MEASKSFARGCVIDRFYKRQVAYERNFRVPFLLSYVLMGYMRVRKGKYTYKLTANHYRKSKSVCVGMYWKITLLISKGDSYDL